MSALFLDWSSTPSGLPVFKRIAEALARKIRSGALPPGCKLPSSRTLGQSVGVHRNTILAAYDELAAQGYITTEAGRGTFVSRDMPSFVERRGSASPPRLMDLDLAPAPRRYEPVHLSFDGLPLLGGLADLRTVPTQVLSRAYRTALKQSKGKTLDYLGLLGHPRFVVAMSAYLGQMRGIHVGEGEMLITRGSQQALYLAALATCQRGSVIAVEKAGYPPAWEAFRLAGAKIQPVSIDDEGLVVSELSKYCDKQTIKAVYVTPHHQYPTTRTLSARRRVQLLALAERHHFVVIEDDYDHEFHFDTQPVLPLKNADTHGAVLHLGTLSKVLAPGLRVGYAVGQHALIDRMAQLRAYVDRQGDHTLELALANMMEDGELGAHVRRMHRAYRIRRLALFDALDQFLGEAIDYERPAGGLAVWVRLRSGASGQALFESAKKHGTLIQPASHFFFDKRDRPFVRLGYARLSEGEILEAVLRLRRAMDEIALATGTAGVNRKKNSTRRGRPPKSVPGPI